MAKASTLIAIEQSSISRATGRSGSRIGFSHALVLGAMADSFAFRRAVGN